MRLINGRKLRTADTGILFLDEIGELGLDEQAMILRAIEDKRFLPVGADTEASSAFQLIAGTNSDLSRAVAAWRFRDDLYARLNLWTFSLPGLADRREDIAPNLAYELDRFAEREGTRITFNKEARERYLAFATAPDARWPGNFRDLAASVTRMVAVDLQLVHPVPTRPPAFRVEILEGRPCSTISYARSSIGCSGGGPSARRLSRSASRYIHWSSPA